VDLPRRADRPGAAGQAAHQVLGLPAAASGLHHDGFVARPPAGARPCGKSPQPPRDPGAHRIPAAYLPCWPASARSSTMPVPMNRDALHAAVWGLVVTAVLAALIVIGSRNLAHFDAALVAYTSSILFATFGLTYRYAMWLRRPPTAVYWRRGWQAFFRRGFRLRNAFTWVGRVASEILANRMILRRGRMRGVTHLLIMWGCL